MYEIFRLVRPYHLRFFYRVHATHVTSTAAGHPVSDLEILDVHALNLPQMTGRNNHGPLRDKRIGCMIHYDASRSDRGAVAWLTKDPTCKVSYNWLVTDDGTAHEIAPHNRRAYHAGVCRSSDSTRLPYKDANSAFYGIAIAATDGETATPAQLATAVRLIEGRFKHHGWDKSETWRIVGHDTEAWPRGRKHDPTGSNPQRPVLDVARVRAIVQG